MIFIEALIAAAATVSAVYAGSEFRNDQSQWGRYDLVLFNAADEPSEVALCPDHPEMVVALDPSVARDQEVREAGFAIKFGDDDWSFNCSARTLAPGESVRLGLFFRPDWSNGYGPRVFFRPDENTAFGPRARVTEVVARTSAGELAIGAPE